MLDLEVLLSNILDADHKMLNTLRGMKKHYSQTLVLQLVFLGHTLNVNKSWNSGFPYHSKNELIQFHFLKILSFKKYLLHEINTVFFGPKYEHNALFSSPEFIQNFLPKYFHIVLFIEYKVHTCKCIRETIQKKNQAFLVLLASFCLHS